MAFRLVHKADFERLLGSKPWAKSSHFVVHHVSGVPAAPVRPGKPAKLEKLSTGLAPICPQVVDDCISEWWLACLVPKRHARRAVTRSLVKRQFRSAFQRYQDALPKGLWLLRLRQPFAVGEFPSASSVALQTAIRLELDRLLAHGLR